jgi:tellurite resistance protein TerC
MKKMLEFVTAYTLEKSLSVDNMFIFLLVFSTLSIPYIYQHRILSVGILSAIVFRILLVLVGVSLLEFPLDDICIWWFINFNCY